MARRIKYPIEKEYDGMKLYTYLKAVLGMSTTSVRKLKHSENGLTLNGGYIRTVDLLKAGDELLITFPEEENRIEPTSAEHLDIVYEDDDVLVLNKPAFLAMHPTHNHQGDTLANEVAAYLAAKGKNTLFRAVGRLDKCTSGLVVCALNRHASSKLQGEYDKTYIAIAGGNFEGRGTINKPICRPDPGKTLRAVGEEGEYAVTHWESIATDGEASVLRVTLETGRTHQIRVHFASLGAPLLGDEMYGSTFTGISRAALHCAEVSFLHPISGEALHFEAPLPEDMRKLATEIMNEKLTN